MEFDELRKIWDTQNREPLYVVNESALHNRILQKKASADHVTEFSELLLIIVNILSGVFVLGVSVLKQSNAFMYMLSAWMLVTAAYVLYSRIQRVRGDNRFDRSILGDLKHAISTASYQVRLSQIMRYNIFPIAILVVLGIWVGGKSPWLAVGILIFFALTHYASRWEHNIYVRRKQELETLQKKMMQEPQNGD